MGNMFEKYPKTILKYTLVWHESTDADNVKYQVKIIFIYKHQIMHLKQLFLTFLFGSI